MICYVKSNIFTVTDIAVLDSGTCSLTTNTYGGTNWKEKYLLKILLNNTVTQFYYKSATNLYMYFEWYSDQ